RSNFGVMLRLVGLVKPLIGFMILAVLMGCVGFLCAEFITIFGGYAILNVLGLDNTFSLTSIFVSVVIFAVARGLLRYGEQSCNHYIAFKLLALIRDKVFRAFRILCPAKLEGRDKGDLISVITSDIELLEVFYAHTISPICIAVILSVLMSLFIGSYSPVLGVIAALAYVGVGAVVPVVISKLSGTSGAEFRRQYGELSSFVLDSLRGLNESIQYGSGEKRLQDLNERTDALSEKQKTMSRNTGWNAAITNTVILVFDLLMLAVSIALYKNGIVGFNGILIPLIAMTSSFGPVAALANLGSTLQNTFAAGNRVLDILDETAVTKEITNGKDILFQGATVDNLSFSYGGEKILDNLSLTIEPGKVTGISGKSGSGKSTLLKLLMRFWDADSGTVRISGVPIGEINTRSLRQMESFVTQETQLFHDTIANNIRIAKLDATQEEIETACRKASVHDFIMSLPHGYDTQVGELGETLSGGERQRIGLARAFLHNAPFLLLDEPTSNLDSLNEAVILKSLAEQSEDKTIVLVSHRESTMRICDKVYSVENGRMS
ncbi:MAG: thiol reductant ABC exporter subunit CydC, partial [Ruminococcus sp.]